MTTLTQFLESPLVHGLLHALGWTLLHFCWQGSIVAAVLWCVLQLLVRRSSQARYVATCIAFLLLVALPLITFSHLATATLQGGRNTWNPSNAIDPAMLLQVNVGSTPAPWPARMAAALDHRVPWLLALWVAGAFFFTARLNYGLLVASRLKSTATELPAAATLQMFDVLRHRLGISRAVRLLHSARVQVPTVIGWLRPVVLIPASCLTGLSTLQIEAIFCHELAHVRRHDYLISVLQSIAEALLFYHPAVWWVSCQVRRERECCCDEIAVANCGDVLAYARALSYLEERRATFPEFALGANGGALSMRIKRLLGYKTEALASQFAACTLLVLMIAVAGSYVATTARAQAKTIAQAKSIAPIVAAPLHAIDLAQAQAAERTSSVQPLHGIYKTWLEQDAAYLITPEERATYLQLKSDEERDKFITEFWDRRDPAGSAPGTFREEHYARIAYTNGHFAANKPGWMTDRGRIYIVYGKPYSVEAHPSGGGSSSYPNEIWHYTYIPGIGHEVKLVFVDTCQCGDYHYTIDGFKAGQRTPSASESVSSAGKILAPQSITPRPVASPVQLVQPGTPYRMYRDSGHPTLGVAPEYNGEPLRKIGGSVSTPTIIFQMEPKYSEEARQAKFNGIVLVNLVVDQNGLPQNVHVLRGVGMGLDEKAVEAIQQYKFKPAIENGEPVPVSLNVEVNFRTFDGPKPQALQSNSKPEVPTVAPSRPDGVTMPLIVYQVEPEYTKAARKAKKSGTVLLNLTVNNRGLPQNVHVIRSLDSGLDKKAVEAVKQYRFKPAMKDNQPIDVALNVEVNFQIF